MAWYKNTKFSWLDFEFVFRFSVSQSQAGPWQNVVEATLEDSHQQNNPLPLQQIDLQTEVTGQFSEICAFGVIWNWGRAAVF